MQLADHLVRSSSKVRGRDELAPGPPFSSGYGSFRDLFDCRHEIRASNSRGLPRFLPDPPQHSALKNVRKLGQGAGIDLAPRFLGAVGEVLKHRH